MSSKLRDLLPSNNYRLVTGDQGFPMANVLILQLAAGKNWSHFWVWRETYVLCSPAKVVCWNTTESICRFSVIPPKRLLEWHYSTLFFRSWPLTYSKFNERKVFFKLFYSLYPLDIYAFNWYKLKPEALMFCYHFLGRFQNNYIYF